MKKEVRQERINFYSQLDLGVSSIDSFNKKFGNSKIIQNYCIQLFSSLVYANLIMNFFNNLNRKYIIENNLPYGQIAKLKKKFYKEIEQCEKVLKGPLQGYLEINNNDYQSIRLKIKKNFSEYMLLVNEM